VSPYAYIYVHIHALHTHRHIHTHTAVDFEWNNYIRKHQTPAASPSRGSSYGAHLAADYQEISAPTTNRSGMNMNASIYSSQSGANTSIYTNPVAPMHGGSSMPAEYGTPRQHRGEPARQDGRDWVVRDERSLNGAGVHAPQGVYTSMRSQGGIGHSLGGSSQHLGGSMYADRSAGLQLYASASSTQSLYASRSGPETMGLRQSLSADYYSGVRNHVGADTGPRHGASSYADSSALRDSWGGASDRGHYQQGGAGYQQGGAGYQQGGSMYNSQSGALYSSQSDTYGAKAAGGMYSSHSDNYNKGAGGMYSSHSDNYNKGAGGMYSSHSDNYNKGAGSMYSSHSDNYNKGAGGIYSSHSDNYNKGAGGMYSSHSDNYNKGAGGMSSSQSGGLYSTHGDNYNNKGAGGGMYSSQSVGLHSTHGDYNNKGVGGMYSSQSGSDAYGSSSMQQSSSNVSYTPGTGYVPTNNNVKWSLSSSSNYPDGAPKRDVSPVRPAQLRTGQMSTSQSAFTPLMGTSSSQFSTAANASGVPGNSFASPAHSRTSSSSSLSTAARTQPQQSYSAPSTPSSLKPASAPLKTDGPNNTKAFGTAGLNHTPAGSENLSVSGASDLDDEVLMLQRAFERSRGAREGDTNIPGNSTAYAKMNGVSEARSNGISETKSNTSVVRSTVPSNLEMGLVVDNFAEGRGWYVREIKEDSAARREGSILVGDRIISVDSVKIDLLKREHVEDLLKVRLDVPCVVHALRAMKPYSAQVLVVSMFHVYMYV
jgi:hypothetical protein